MLPDLTVDVVLKIETVGLRSKGLKRLRQLSRRLRAGLGRVNKSLSTA